MARKEPSNLDQVTEGGVKETNVVDGTGGSNEAHVAPVTTIVSATAAALLTSPPLDLELPSTVEAPSTSAFLVFTSENNVNEAISRPNTEAEQTADVHCSSDPPVMEEAPHTSAPESVGSGVSHPLPTKEVEDEWASSDWLEEPSLEPVETRLGDDPFADEDNTPSVSASSGYSPKGSGVGKKTMKKMALSVKDNEKSNMLDAYASVEETPTKTRALLEEVKTPTAPVVRSLRPGGGATAVKVSVGRVEDKKFVYTKAEIGALMPGGQMDRPQCMQCYENIDSEASRKPVGTSGSSNFPPTGGDKWSKQVPQGHHYQQQQQSAQSQQQLLHSVAESEWKKGSSGVGGGAGLGTRLGNRRAHEPAGPMPKKIILDPAELLSRTVQDILNKITPQTFSKLTGKLCDIPIDTNELLDLMIHKVFEKAISVKYVYLKPCFLVFLALTIIHLIRSLILPTCMRTCVWP